MSLAYVFFFYKFSDEKYSFDIFVNIGIFLGLYVVCIFAVIGLAGQRTRN